MFFMEVFASFSLAVLIVENLGVSIDNQSCP